jgi:hypothetical protein
VVVVAAAAALQATGNPHQIDQKPKQWYWCWPSAGVSIGEYGLSYHYKNEDDIVSLITLYSER